MTRASDGATAGDRRRVRRRRRRPGRRRTASPCSARRPARPAAQSRPAAPRRTRPPATASTAARHGRGKPLVLAMLGDSSAVGLGVDRAAETPGCSSPPRSPSWPSARSGWSGWPCPARCRASSTAQVEQALRRAARRRRDHDRRERRHQPRPAGGVGAAPRRRRPPAGRGRLPGRRRHLPRPRHHPARSPSRCASSPGAGAGSWPPRRRSPSSRPAGAPCRSARCSAPRSPPTASLFSVDEFHPSAAGYAAAAAVLLPSVADAIGVWPAVGRPRPAACAASTVRPVATGRRAGRRPHRHRGAARPRCAARTPGRGGRGRGCAAAGRRRSPRPRRREEPAEAPVAG